MATTLTTAVAAQFLRAGDKIVLAGEEATVTGAFRFTSDGFFCEEGPAVLIDSVLTDGIKETTHVPFGTFIEVL
jgi:hypothetical protein